MSKKFASIAVASVVGAISPVLSQVPIRTLAFTGQQVPNDPAGRAFTGFGAASLSNFSEAVFHAAINNDHSLDSVWLGPPSGIARQVGVNEQAPGMPSGVRFSSFFTSRINDSGGWSIPAFVTGAGVDSTNDFGVWATAGRGAGLQLAAREGDQAPGTSAGVGYANMSTSMFGNGGHVTILSNLAGPGIVATNNAGIWSGTPGAIALVARRGSQAPGTPTGVNFNFRNVFDDAIPTASADGTTVFTSPLTGPGVNATNDSGMWIGQPGAVQMVAREGDSAPGTASGVQFTRFSASTPIADSNVVAFAGALSGAGVSPTNDTGIWRGTPGALGLVIREGALAPGTSLPFGDLFGTRLNNVGSVAFVGSARQQNGMELEGVWSDAAGSLALVALAGQPAPGFPVGTTFRTFSYLMPNDAGQLAFLANTTLGVGLYATDLDGELQLVARAGTEIEVSPGDTRTVAGIGLFSLNGGQETLNSSISGFNALGELAFSVSFTDNSSGNFVAYVPEPSGLFACAILVVICARRRTV